LERAGGAERDRGGAERDRYIPERALMKKKGDPRI